MAGGQYTGTGHLTTGSLTFSSGELGGAVASYPKGSTTVNGSTTFNGASTLNVTSGHTLTLNGNSNWTAGDGKISGSISGGAIISSVGTTFTDAGAASSTGVRSLREASSGSFTNFGTYDRNGVGSTRAYRFDNQGTIHINSGTFAADRNLSNAGEITIASGATLRAIDSTLNNVGQISGTGTIKTYSASDHLTNSGTLAPGSAGVPIGRLTIDGDLSNTDTAIFSVDLGAGGTADLLAISDDVLWNGTLSVHATPGLALNVGDSFVVATFDQRLSNSVFDTVTWHGASGTQFTVDYNAHDVTLRVTAAVPEPATYALWLLGLAGLGVWRSRKHRGPR